jgi:hypothetical protein
MGALCVSFVCLFHGNGPRVSGLHPACSAGFNTVDHQHEPCILFAIATQLANSKTGWVRDEAPQAQQSSHDTVGSTAVMSRKKGCCMQEWPLCITAYMSDMVSDPLRCKKLEHTTLTRHNFHTRLVNLNQRYCTVAYSAYSRCNVLLVEVTFGSAGDVW